MSQILWFMLVWIAGTTAILGSLMTLGSLLLWLLPLSSARSRQPQVQTIAAAPVWHDRLKLLAFSVAIAVVGLSILVVMPFPMV